MKYGLVTGGTKGIGRAFVLELLSKDFFVIINYNSDEHSAELLDSELCNMYSKQYIFLKCDLSNYANIGGFCEKIKECTPHIDILAFNVGYTDRTAFPNINIDDWNKALNTNLTVPLFILQNIVNHIKEGGNIVFTSSLMGIYPHSLSLSYGVTKSAVNSLVKNLVKFLKEYSVRVNAIVPGFIETEWQKDKPIEVRQSIESKIADGKFGDPRDVAQTLSFIIDNKYINGQLIVIDGGYCYK